MDLIGPIFARELLTTPRRPRHYILRSAYLAVFFVLMWTAWQAIVGFQKVQRVGDFAAFNHILFEVFSYTQLTLVLFGASLYGTSSISHEKDRRTFVLLLVTRLLDSEIVIEKFLCGVLQLLIVLAAALPLFCLTLLLGGVGLEQVLQVYAATLGATVLGCAVGVLVAAWREKTFQAVAMTMLVLVLGLLGVEVVMAFAADLELPGPSVRAYAEILSPFRAIAVVSQPWNSGAVGLGVHPTWLHLLLSVVGAAGCLAFATFRLRAWNPRGEPIQQLEAAPEGVDSTQAHPRRDPFRKVWSNPVLWREIETNAYGTRPILIKIGYVLVFAILLAGTLTAQAGPAMRADLLIAAYLLPLVIVSLLLINAQSVASVTSERDLRSIDLLLATDVTAREFVWGKLLGSLYNTKEMVILPLAMLVVCAVAGKITLAGLGYSAVTILVFVLFATALGLHAAFRYDSTKLALANSLGTMFLLFVGILLCLFLILISGRFEAQWASFIVFIVLGSIGLWVSLRANAPSNAIGISASITPYFTFYCVVAFLVGDRAIPFLVGVGVYGFAVLAILIPLLHEFDVATGRTTAEEG